MYIEWNIYVAYRKAQANHFDRGHRLPKNWEHHWNEKLNKTARDNLTTLTNYFNTKWNSLNLDFYMYCGFEVLKTFSYKNFTEKRIINKYIHKDKQIKREVNDVRRSLIDSIKYIKSKSSMNDILTEYCLNEENILTDYISNSISVVLLVFLNKYGYVKFSDFFKSKTPYFLSNYERASIELDKHREFCKKIIRSYLYE